MRADVYEVFEKALAEFRTRQHTEGVWALGAVEKDKPKKGKPWPEAHEVNPWEDDVIRVDAMSPLGALCFVRKQPPDDHLVVACVEVLQQKLTDREIQWTLEAWSDAPGVDHAAVTELFEEILDGATITDQIAI